ncbi:MAG: Sodium/glucose cotransporter [Owenweeksia sp. TMED14]|nr:MAG: Sodium/glucose cotransporter [Owenweeksia sp. TMED14]
MGSNLSSIDWVTLLGTLGTIVGVGIWKTRKKTSGNEFLIGKKDSHWITIGLGIIATQASAITFISTPGQGFSDGLRFVQFYFGMPVALLIIALFIVPRYINSGVLTAYSFLYRIFGSKVRWLAASLFLLSRSLSAGITLYAPAIVLSAVFGWNLNLTILITGAVVIIYTVFGGYKAVGVTQSFQMLVVFCGLFASGFVLLYELPTNVGLTQSWALMDVYNRTQILDWSIDPSSRYTVWSGLAGGFFLAMAYFGTDQSQVGRYLGGKSMREIRIGMGFTALIKIPMQLFILGLGLLLFTTMHFKDEPLWHNPSVNSKWEKINSSESNQLKKSWDSMIIKRRISALAFSSNTSMSQHSYRSQLQILDHKRDSLKSQATSLILNNFPGLETKDTDYVFLGWAIKSLPVGVLGLLLAVILSGAMSSCSAELNALSATSIVDFKEAFGWTQETTVFASRLLTSLWGVVALVVALSASLSENLIQLVNIIGSLFYGPMLGLFSCAWLFPKLRRNAVFIGGLVSQVFVLGLHFLNVFDFIQLGYLWYNLIGCLIVLILSWVLSLRFLNI